LQSASHGAGRLYSRSDCKNRFTRSAFQEQVASKGVKLLGGSVDESPMAYKNIEHVMGNQQELVETIGVFQPRIVRMDK